MFFTISTISLSPCLLSLISVQTFFNIHSSSVISLSWPLTSSKNNKNYKQFISLCFILRLKQTSSRLSSALSSRYVTSTTISPPPSPHSVRSDDPLRRYDHSTFPILHDIFPKMPESFMTFARKIFYRNLAYPTPMVRDVSSEAFWSTANVSGGVFTSAVVRPSVAESQRTRCTCAWSYVETRNAWKLDR